MAIADEDIQWLLALVESEDLAEIEVHDDGGEVLVKRLDASAARAHCLEAEAVAQPLPPVLPENVVSIVAPMSGVFYRAPSPETPSYAEVGQSIEVGDTIGIIEAMKLFNDVPATVSGEVYSVVAGNEEHVEAGQTLILVET